MYICTYHQLHSDTSSLLVNFLVVLDYIGLLTLLVRYQPSSWLLTDILPYTIFTTGVTNSTCGRGCPGGGGGGTQVQRGAAPEEGVFFEDLRMSAIL